METADRIKFKQIFEAAADLPVSERVNFLAERCSGNDKLRGDIERLLAADEAAGAFLESSPFGDSANDLARRRTASFIGQTIGVYKIEREIGVGGMGTVFLAERGLGDVRQRVAIKIVHQGAHSSEIVRRFLIERKILAELEHSGIARLIDVGETPEGLPYLAMEYIEGKPLDEYCRSASLSIERRLRLFQKVCAAVAYAHRRLIIHRDLKPSNILVTADGEAKLLDFGIAKLLAPLDADTLRTATLMNLLTPAYAAPEQLRGETVTTATDVYSLGVILYELLAGVSPFSFGDKNYAEIVRIICETEPPKPSEANTIENKISDTGEKRDALTGDDSIGRFVGGVGRSLRGDLDNIILKALRKDPERRYRGVEQLSEDIERYLKGLPVSARPDTFSYRATKFVERNRLAVASSGVIVLLLVAGVFGTAWQAVRANRERSIAEQRFAQVRELANDVIFKYHDSIANLSGSTEVRKMLVQDATKYLDNLSQDAETDEGLQNELALAYAKLADVQGKPYYANTGDTSGAMENYSKSINLLEDLTRSKDASVISKAEEELITTYHSYSALNSRTFNFDAAVSSQQKALDLAAKYLALDPRDLERKLTFARANLWLGDAYSEAGNFPKAVDHYRQLVDLAEETYTQSPADKDAATLLGAAHDRIGRGSMLRGQELARTDFPAEQIAGIYRESYVNLAKALELFEKVASENPDNQKYQRNFTDGQSNFGMALRNTGEIDRSLEILQEAVAKHAKNLESDAGNRQLKSDYAEDLHQLALTLNAKNESIRAAAELRSALQIMDALIADDADNMELRRIQLEMTSDLGHMFLMRNDRAEAIKIYKTSLEQLTAPANPSALPFVSYARGLMNKDLGDCYMRLAAKTSIPAGEPQALLDEAHRSYQDARNSWQGSDVRRRYLSRTPEMLEYLDRQLSNSAPRD